MIPREEDHSEKKTYPTPIKAQEIIDNLNTVISIAETPPTSTGPIDIKDGVEVIDVKAIAKKEDK